MPEFLDNPFGREVAGGDSVLEVLLACIIITREAKKTVRAWLPVDGTYLERSK
jgi:hypothetical protein